MRSPKELILSMISRELRTAYQLRYEAENQVKAYKAILNRALQFVEELDYWRAEANKKDRLFADIVREVDGAEDLHNLKQVVRMMAYREEYSGIVVKDPGKEPKVVVSDTPVM